MAGVPAPTAAGLAALACSLLGQVAAVVAVARAPAARALLLVKIPWWDTELGLREEKRSL